MRPVSNRDMIQHVGAKYHKLYFKLVDFSLKPNNATAVVTASTFPESRYSNYQYVVIFQVVQPMSLLLSERKTLCANTCGQTLASQVQQVLSLPHTHHHRVASLSRVSRTMQPVSPFDLSYKISTYSLIRLPSHSSRVGKEIRSQTYTRHGRKRLPRTPGSF